MKLLLSYLALKVYSLTIPYDTANSQINTEILVQTTTEEVFTTVPEETLGGLGDSVTTTMNSYIYMTPMVTSTTTEEVFTTVPEETPTTTEEVFTSVPEETLGGLGDSVTTTMNSYIYMTPMVTSTTTQEVFTSVPEETLGSSGDADNVIMVPVAVSSDDEGFSRIRNVKNKKKHFKEISNKHTTMVRFSGKDFCNAVGLGGFISNGTQQKFETCSVTVQGSIPSFDNMISTVITSPEDGEKFNLGFEFLTVVVNSTGIEFGFFDDPSTLYYSSPQKLNSNGLVKGHSHISITQIIKGVIPDPRNPLFFKGLNEKSSDGSLNVTISGDIFKVPGIYRICTLTASQSHAPVLMPVAKRGFSDDCIRIEIAN